VRVQGSGRASAARCAATSSAMPRAASASSASSSARLKGFAERFWRLNFGALSAADRRDVARTRRRCRQALGRAAGQRCWDEGAALDLAQAVALARA
jgi:hypothetical protein